VVVVVIDDLLDQTGMSMPGQLWTLAGEQG
jgi:hypothetical protein